MIKVGAFTFDPSTETLSGPADYMTEQGNAKMEAILAGRSHVFNFGMRKPGADPVRIAMVTLQTDYAGWKGARDLLARTSR